MGANHRWVDPADCGSAVDRGTHHGGPDDTCAGH